MISPSGDEIQGLSNKVLGACRVTFDADEEGGFSYDGDTKMFWDASETQKIDGVPLFTDASGYDWLQHHLIPEGSDALFAKTIDLIHAELRQGEALVAAEEMVRSIKNISDRRPDGGVEAIELLRDWLRQEYHKLRDEVKAAIAAELAEQKVEEEE